MDPDAPSNPLIRPHSRSSSARSSLDHHHHPTLESGLEHPSPFIWALTFAAGISGLLFGYDTGVISATLVSLGSSLDGRPLTTLDKSLVTSVTSLFALLASPLAGLLADRWGRRRVILLADVLFVLGALGQAGASTVAGMIAGRAVVGLAVGGASLVVPLYISELSPSAFRGRLVTLSVMFITVGQVVAYVVGFLFSRRESGWRWMVGLGALPAALQAVALVFMPETPRWLVSMEKSEEARLVLRKIYGAQEGMRSLVFQVIRGIEEEVEEEDQARRIRGAEQVKSSAAPWKRIPGIGVGFTELFGIGRNIRALTIACLLQGLQQLCGFNSLMYFSATIFSMVGFASPTLTALVIAIANFLFTLLAFTLIDRLGRRRILLWSISIMVIGLALCSIAFGFVKLPERPARNSDTSKDTAAAGLWPWLILASMAIYVCGYAVGMGNVPWQQSELFPLSVRSLGSGIATATNWGSNFVIGLTFLPMLDILSPSGTFALYMGVCVVGWGAVWRIYPETKGLSLEEVGGLLEHGWVVG
ncbi:MAG: hypothetical protein M1829_004364 [Trizodia sp. TS-e1964]|nr:MAG: hypothetical protein M1829_004364 [Trizodia sp. TS-e1964]